MAIQLNPNFIPAATGRPAEKRRERTQGKLPPAPRQVAHINYIPAPESLRTVIASALESFRGGVIWDRGSIINLLV
ncbi:MAG: hypothetical protein AB7L92_01865 [Alphaproteobacteria bacterium]